MGSIADRTQTRWGHFRPISSGRNPLRGGRVFTFTTPNLSGGGKVIYAYITYSLLMFIYTFVNIPYSALMGVISPNSLERTSIASIRFMGAFTARFIQYFTLKLSNGSVRVTRRAAGSSPWCSTAFWPLSCWCSAPDHA